MKIRPFKLERYFAEHEFSTRYLLSASDCESLPLANLLALADAETRDLWDQLRLGYTESQGHPRLRADIAQQYAQVSDSHVLVAAPEEAIFIAMHALLEPGDEVIVTWPAYQSLTEIATSIGCRVKPWALRLTGRQWGLDMDELVALITPRTRLLVVNFPHNPTGCHPGHDEWRRIIEIVRRYGLHLFSDEMYRLLERSATDRLEAGCDAYERGITLSGLSKSYGLPGLRIGWLATQDAGALRRCAALKDYTTICASAPSEILAMIALRARERLTERNRSIIAVNLAVADAFFAQRAGAFIWPAPAAGPVAFPLLTTGQGVDAWSAEVLAAHSVMIVPASMFDAGGNHFRIGLGRQNFGEALGQLP